MEIKINLEGLKAGTNEKGETFEEWCERIETEKKELSQGDIIEACAKASHMVFEKTGDPSMVLVGALFAKEMVRTLFDEEE